MRTLVTVSQITKRFYKDFELQQEVRLEAARSEHPGEADSSDEESTSSDSDESEDDSASVSSAEDGYAHLLTDA
jgi:hypothetical protein